MAMRSTGVFALTGAPEVTTKLDLTEGTVYLVNGQRCIVQRNSSGMVEFVREPLPEEIIKRLSDEAADRNERLKRIEEATGGPPRNRAERRRAAKIIQRLR